MNSDEADEGLPQAQGYARELCAFEREKICGFLFVRDQNFVFKQAIDALFDARRVDAREDDVG